jgi:hypothetical protein
MCLTIHDWARVYRYTVDRIRETVGREREEQCLPYMSFWRFIATEYFTK